MLARIISAGSSGIEGLLVEVEVDVSMGLPSFEVVGLPDAAVKEARERIRAALKNIGYTFPSQKITINLAPAHIKKSGAGFDLAMALGILLAGGLLDLKGAPKSAFIGEIALDGRIKPVVGVLSMVMTLAEKGVPTVFVPKENSDEAALMSHGIQVIAVSTLEEVIDILLQKTLPTYHTTDVEGILKETPNLEVGDFNEVRGQHHVKRALEVAAAGNHHLLMVGSPGAGKTMLARRFAGILPPLSREESLEVTKVYSVAGLLLEDEKIVTRRPFRSPHHTISEVGLTGGGSNPQPGEISLAHNGVLYLDEMPEFKRKTLDLLRQPLEDRLITIVRKAGSFTFPANVMLVGSMNPCPCGYNNHPSHPCTCSPHQITRYLQSISGPLFDRIDLQIEMPPLDLHVFKEPLEGEESSATIRERVVKARKIQEERYQDLHIRTNGELSGSLLDRFCPMDDELKTNLIEICERLQFSARAYHKIIKLARTIADLQGAAMIQKNHVAEALQYRDLDRNHLFR